MAEVQAIKDLDTVKLISYLLEKRCSKQMSHIWNIGLNLALRISDLLSVKFTDIQNDRLLIFESKTDIEFIDQSFGASEYFYVFDHYNFSSTQA